MRLSGRYKRISLNPLRLDDIYKMRKWGLHNNPLLIGYNFPKLTDKEIEIWYKAKTNSFFSKYYAILNEEDLYIGYVGIKKINIILRYGTLGIVLDPNYIDKGYGKEVLRFLLYNYFNKLKMRKLYLEVDRFNKRAYNVYKSLGFKIIDEYLAEFLYGDLDKNSRYYIDAEEDFVRKDGKIYNYIYKMEIRRDDYLKYSREELWS